MDFRVDAIITTYNEPADKINITISSCLNQSLPFDNIFIIDDGSINSAENLLIHDSRVRYIRLKTNQGISAARNFGLNISTAPYVGIINVDLELSSNWLAVLMNDFSSRNDLGGAFGKLEPISNSLISKWRMRFHEQNYSNISGEAVFAPGHAVLFDKSKLAQIGFYDEKLKLVHEDADICYRIKNIGSGIYYNSNVAAISHQMDSIDLLSRKHLVRMTFGKKNEMDILEFLLIWSKDFIIRLGRNISKARFAFIPLDIIITIRCFLLYFKKLRST